MKTTTPLNIRTVTNGYIVSESAAKDYMCGHEHVFTCAASLGAFVTQFYAGNHAQDDIATAREAAEASAHIRTGIVDNIDDKIHNPDGLTDDVIGVADGWRLLRKSEIKARTCSHKMQQWWTDFNRWDDSEYEGSAKDMTYRTRIPYGKLDEEAAR